MSGVRSFAVRFAKGRYLTLRGSMKSVVLVSVLVIGFFVIAEGIALFRLYRSINGHHSYWMERAKADGEILYVALGDSAAQGIGASHPEKGYVGLIADRLAETNGKSVKVVNVSKSGAKVGDVLRGQLPAVASLKPDVVTIEIGANDVATFNAEQFKNEFTELIERLPEGSYVSNMPYFGSRPARRPMALQATEIIEKAMANQSRLQLVDLQTITKERDSLRGYAADYFHPNNRAYVNWADAFWQEMEEHSGQL